MASKKVQPVTAGKTDVVVMPTSGLVHRTSLDRISAKGRLAIPNLRDLTNEMTGVWGSGDMSDQDVMDNLVRMVADGASLNNALEALTSAYGNMPSRWMVEKWRKTRKDFQNDLDTAYAIQADLLVDAATEIVLTSDDPASASTAKIKENHLRWKAGKYDRKRFGETKDIQFEAEIKLTPTDRLMDELKHLLKDKEFRSMVSTSDLKELGMVEDAELVTDQPDQPATATPQEPDRT